jgi:hypothetical protein
MFSKLTASVSTGRNVRAAIVALVFVIALTTMTGCFESPRANYTLGGAALGAGAGALLGGAEGSPGEGALIGGLGGGAVGYLVGTETEHYYGYGQYGRGYYSPYYYGGW